MYIELTYVGREECKYFNLRVVPLITVFFLLKVAKQTHHEAQRDWEEGRETDFCFTFINFFFLKI